MYKLVIIDDDRDVILGLRSYIQKQDSQILVSGFAYDGLSGFELISKERPDIILCDISMPKASGFQMIDKLHSIHDYSPVIIIISGHDDFQHAKEAIKYQIFDYLIKPIMPDEILAALQKAKSACNNILNAMNSSKQKQDVLKSVLIEQLLHSPNFPDDDIYEKQQELGLNLNSDFYTVLRLQIFNYDSIARSVSAERLNNFKKEVTQAFENEFSKCFRTHFNDSHIYFLILTENNDYDSLTALCNKIKDKLSGNIEFFICISEISDSIHTLSLLASHAKYCFKYSFCFTQSTVLPYLNIEQEKKNIFLSKTLLDIEKESLALKHINTSDYNAYMDRIFSEIRSYKYYDQDYVKQLLYNIIKNIIGLALSDTSISSSDIDSDNILYLNISRTKSIKELMDFCCDFVEKSFVLDTAYSSKRGKMLSEQVKQYVAAKYAQPITMEEISRSLYLSASYLNRLFLKENGISFKNYLKDFRMKTARNLLETGNYKIYEAALMVGYKDVKSFRKNFIDVFGYSPSNIK